MQKLILVISLFYIATVCDKKPKHRKSKTFIIRELTSIRIVFQLHQYQLVAMHRRSIGMAIALQEHYLIAGIICTRPYKLS